MIEITDKLVIMIIIDWYFAETIDFDMIGKIRLNGVYLCMCVYVSMCICACMYACMYECMNASMYECMNV